ncbi:MAG: hypothetical protein K8I82_18755, partial [Anaerolineae bacterium]|nr:hypothetical protein [Anaerolineae bacterium]
MRNGFLGIILLILGIGGLLVGGVLDSPSTAGLLLLAVGMVGTGLFIWSGRRQTLTRSERENYAWKLRGTRERERAFYELATTLSLTLDFQKVLEATQEIGRLALRDPNSSERLASVVFLFQGERRELHPLS